MRGIIFHIPGQHHVVAVLGPIGVVDVLKPVQLAESASTWIGCLIAPVALNADDRLGLGLGVGGIEDGHTHVGRGRGTWICGGINRTGERQLNIAWYRPGHGGDSHTRQEVRIIAEQHIAGHRLQIRWAINRDRCGAIAGVRDNLGVRADANAVIDAGVTDRVNSVWPHTTAKGRDNPNRSHHADCAGQFAVEVFLHLSGIG
jgi:hypothetical protein